jgi:hypothetical protein
MACEPLIVKQNEHKIGFSYAIYMKKHDILIISIYFDGLKQDIFSVDF